jgi:hypothetical protein
LAGDHFAKTSGYEYYGKGARIMREAGGDQAAKFFRDLQVWGTPAQCVDKIVAIKETINAEEFVANVSYGGLPYEEVEANLRLYASEVAPRVKRIPAAGRTSAAPSTMPTSMAGRA